MLLTLDALRGSLRSIVGSTEWWAAAARRHWPFLALLSGYVVVEFAINRRNFVIVEGHYRPGHHVMTNALRYVTTLYVGRNTWTSYVMLMLALATILLTAYGMGSADPRDGILSRSVQPLERRGLV